MTKYKVKFLQIDLEDGTVIHRTGATLSVSENARKAGGYKNAQEWTEYHITWIEYHEASAPAPVGESIQDQVERRKEEAIKAEDYLNDPNFVGIEYGQPRFKKQTQYDFDDFGFDEIFKGHNNGQG